MVRAVDRAVVGFSRRRSLVVLRIALGLVFAWFGLLKLIGHSPVDGFLTATVPWVREDYLVPAIGAMEIVIGLGLLAALWLPLVVVLVWVQIAGLLVAVALRTHVAFQPDAPLVPTVLGDFVLRGVLLLLAALVVATAARR